MKIRILATGGTFDKRYDEIAQTLSFKDTHLMQVLKAGRCALDVEVEILFLKDSLEITDADRCRIAEKCMQAPENAIVITHGTDTVDKTAAYLAEHVKGKTIVLTGAMVPYTFGSSDGLFNLGCALAFVQTMPEGVYVAMNGLCFGAKNVRKDLKTGTFHSKNRQKESGR